MIASVSGTVLSLSASSAVISVGGIGLAVTLTARHAGELRVGESATVSTALIVREDELSLYGFPDQAHREVFDLLIGVSGVGPKSAMSVMSELTIDEIAGAVASENDAPFRKAQGIGPKTAKLIIVSLAGKLFAPADEVRARTAADSDVAARVVSALTGLGWNEKTADGVVADVITTASDHDRSNVQSLLRLALAELGPRAPQGAGR